MQTHRADKLWHSRKSKHKHCVTHQCCSKGYRARQLLLDDQQQLRLKNPQNTNKNFNTTTYGCQTKPADGTFKKHLRQQLFT